MGGAADDLVHGEGAADIGVVQINVEAGGAVGYHDEEHKSHCGHLHCTKGSFAHPPPMSYRKTYTHRGTL